MVRGCASAGLPLLFAPAGFFSLPGTRLALLGLTIESEYPVKRDEGSDFFKSIPHKTNGRDTTGLALKAWMLGGFRSYAVARPEKSNRIRSTCASVG
jgi:hypothetical protein